MRRYERDLMLDFLTLGVAVLSLRVIVFAFATMIKSSERVFGELFTISIISFGSSYLLLQAIKYLLSFKISFSDWPFNFLWFLTIVSGTFLFTFFSFESKLFGSLRVFIGFLLVALIPSAFFRLAANFVTSYGQERKGSAKLSIVR
jgi:hypothetical protein